jgi:hypothetical protein
MREMHHRYQQEYGTTMATIPTVTEKLLIELADAIEGLNYLRPEKFDNALHEETWDKRLERKRVLVARAKGLLYVEPRKADTRDNARRIRSAKQSIKQYDPETEGIGTAMVDCLTNLMHLASSEGIAFDACVDMALTHFNEE